MNIYTVKIIDNRSIVPSINVKCDCLATVNALINAYVTEAKKEYRRTEELFYLYYPEIFEEAQEWLKLNALCHFEKTPEKSLHFHKGVLDIIIIPEKVLMVEDSAVDYVKDRINNTDMIEERWE